MDLDKIKYINLYSANSISELTDAQFQEIINYSISLEKLPPEAAKADDNDFMDLKEEDFCGGEILDQYPNLYKECSSENFDYYGITDETTYETISAHYAN
ncbi:hypothetical protein RhiirA5_435360 [Rhizophagus irregularis]|uniref:Uncharacterized protein n=1 Tax=Rhizophagus irregularis TaxID=588596 RepID=A0A2N0NNM3_9GLOM|nr:hypothetical protein RhiirA5_435360 [Rhizophagus irregularis]